MLTPAQAVGVERPKPPVPSRDAITTRVRGTCEQVVTAVSCLDSPSLAVAVARPLLVSMHDRIEAERRWLHGDAADGASPAGGLVAYDACLLRLDAVVLGIVAGDDWVCCPFRHEAVDRLRAATLDLVEASRWAR